MNNNGEFQLTAAISAADLAKLHRRVAFLEAAVVQMLRAETSLKEWFSAREIADLRLPGLPSSPWGIARVARGWEFRIVRGQGGEHRQYHFASLPRRAFEAFIARVVRGGGDPTAATAEPDAASPTLEPAAAFPALAPAPEAAAPAPSNAMPVWLLPLVRLLRGGGGPLERALADLPRHMAPGALQPSPADAQAILARLGVSTG